MSEYKLEAKKREIFGKKLKEAREQGLVPAIVYGKGKENINLFVGENIFNKIFKNTGENTLIELSIEGEKEIKNVLAHEVQTDPVTDKIIHIDFFEVRMDEEVETEVPLTFIGESLAVKNMGGTLSTNKDSIEVKSLPGNIPKEIEVDISILKTFEDSILAKDLNIPSNVELLTDKEETIAFVNPPRSEEELAELEEKVEEDVESVEKVEEKEEKEETKEEAKEEEKTEEEEPKDKEEEK